MRFESGDRTGRKVRLGREVATYVVGRDLRYVALTREASRELVVGALVGRDRSRREASAGAVAQEVVGRAVKSEHRSDYDLLRSKVQGERLGHHERPLPRMPQFIRTFPPRYEGTSTSICGIGVGEAWHPWQHRM